MLDVRAMGSILAAVAALVLAFSQTASAARPTPYNFADLAEGLLPTVVNISSAQTYGGGFDETSPLAPFNRKFGGNRAVSLGSGFIVSKDGIVVTNYHVIEEADEISATLHDGRTYVADVIGVDQATDIAVLKLKLGPKDDVEYVRFGDSDRVRVGEWVIAIGNPFGLGGTVTVGIVSARNRDIQVGQYDDFIQTDAAINRGNSGGPLFDLDGRVIGVNTAIFSQSGGSVGVGFAVPSSLTERIVQQIVQFGEARRGWLGVNIDQVSEQIAEQLGLGSARGARISYVEAGSPAATAGIRTNDVIVSFNNTKIDRYRDLPQAVADAEIGQTVPVEIIREGKRMRLSVTIREQVQRLAQSDSSYKGMTLEPVSDDLRARYGIASDVDGVVVTRIDPQSPAHGLLQPGDVILEMGWEETKTPDDVVSRMDKLSNINKGPVTVYIQRGDTRMYETLRSDD